ncbi:GGDEF domain-containing protein [Nakamurella lactea]|uniref:GGDEF domain-containing protein n=1 Tax=Nakamurella lactea TaxID=459515 RepID=UPI0003F93F6A|nr:GGDEF domain-containing protein [Nakamurella lactea]
MNPASRRRIYLVFAPLGWVVIAAVWFLQQEQSPVIRFTYPVLFGYLIVAWMLLRLGADRNVVAIERSTFWVIAAFWLASMGIRLATTADPQVAWRGLSPSIFMGLTILVVMAFLWFDTGPALRNALLLVVVSSVIGLLYFGPHHGPGDTLLIDFIRYEMYLGITAVFVFALARSKDALLRTRVEAERMRTMAYRDQLTGLDNRRQALDELNRLAASGAPVAVALLDLDEFKAINDGHGHDVGDQVLIGVAEVLRGAGAKVTARWGGEEFLLVFEGDQPVAVAAAGRVRAQLAGAHFPDGVLVTASFGIASLAATGTVTELLRIADKALYRAKNAGRDTIREQLSRSDRLVD